MCNTDLVYFTQWAFKGGLFKSEEMRQRKGEAGLFVKQHSCNWKKDSVNMFPNHQQPNQFKIKLIK